MHRYPTKMFAYWALLLVATPVWGQEPPTSTSSSVPTPTTGGRDQDSPPPWVTEQGRGADDGPPPWVREQDRQGNGDDDGDGGDGPPPWAREESRRQDDGPPPWAKDEDGQQQQQQGRGDDEDGPPPWVLQQQQQEDQGPPPASTTMSNSLATTPTPAAPTFSPNLNMEGTAMPPGPRAPTNSAPRNVIIVIAVLISTVIFTGIVMVTIVFMDRKFQRRARTEMAAGRRSKMPGGMIKALRWRGLRRIPSEPSMQPMRQHHSPQEWGEAALMAPRRARSREGDRGEHARGVETASSPWLTEGGGKAGPPYSGSAHSSMAVEVATPSYDTAFNSHRYSRHWPASLSRSSTLVVAADPLDPTNPFGAGAVKTINTKG